VKRSAELADISAPTKEDDGDDEVQSLYCFPEVIIGPTIQM
jgi:hypothetical protein